MSSDTENLYAFPRVLPKVKVPPDEALSLIECYAGMTLRDYFAGQALAGFPQHHFSNNEADIGARHAYRLADAMLREREKGGA